MKHVECTVHTISMLVCMNIHTAAVWVGIMKARVLRVCAWCVCMCVCVCVCVYYSISHDSACVSRQEVVVIISASLNLFACSCSSAV